MLCRTNKVIPTLGLIFVLVPLPYLAIAQQADIVTEVTLSTSDGEDVVIDQDGTRVPQDVRDRFAQIRAARRSDPGNPYAGLSQPGVKVAIGLDAPESEAIRVFLLSSGIESYQGELAAIDFEKLKDAKSLLTNKNYATSEVLDLCRELLALNGNYEPKEIIAEQIAAQLTATDKLEADYINAVFNHLLSTVSSPARQFISSEKARVHGRISSASQDWYYVSENNPDFLIESRINFCSKI